MADMYRSPHGCSRGHACPLTPQVHRRAFGKIPARRHGVVRRVGAKAEQADGGYRLGLGDVRLVCLDEADMQMEDDGMRWGDVCVGEG